MDQKPLPMALDASETAPLPPSPGATAGSLRAPLPRPGIQWNTLFSSVFDFFDPNKAGQPSGQSSSPSTEQPPARRRTTTGGGEGDLLVPVSEWPDFNSDSEEEETLAGDLDLAGGDNVPSAGGPGATGAIERQSPRFSLPHYGSRSGLIGVSRGSDAVIGAASGIAASNSYSDEEIDEDELFHDPIFQDALDEISGIDGDPATADQVDPLLLVQVAQEMADEETRRSTVDGDDFPVLVEGDHEGEEEEDDNAPDDKVPPGGTGAATGGDEEGPEAIRRVSSRSHKSSRPSH